VVTVEIIVGVLLGILYIKSRLPKETIEQQTKLIAALEGRIKTMEDDNKILLRKHVENEKAIAMLEGQIKVYKELPLQDIAKSLKALENIPTEFEKITKINTDKILGAITNVQVQHVKTQNVDHETVTRRD
jgi:hypothetical protein